MQVFMYKSSSKRALRNFFLCVIFADKYAPQADIALEMSIIHVILIILVIASRIFFKNPENAVFVSLQYVNV